MNRKDYVRVNGRRKELAGDRAQWQALVLVVMNFLGSVTKQFVS